MKIKCIDSIFIHYIKNIEIPGFLTKGKIYNVLHESNDKYTIFDDTNMKDSYEKSRFIELYSHRENLIEELLK